MRSTIDNLLETDRLTIDDSRWMLGECTRRMVPSSELAGWWEGYESVAMAFAASETVCGRSMVEMRQGLEYCRADDVCGEELVAASKMILSAMVVFVTNPSASLMFSQDVMHDDLDPLIRKGLMLMDFVADEIDQLDAHQPYRVLVDFNADRPEEIKQRNERNRMEYLIQTAVRPQ